MVLGQCLVYALPMKLSIAHIATHDSLKVEDTLRATVAHRWRARIEGNITLENN